MKQTLILVVIYCSFFPAAWAGDKSKKEKISIQILDSVSAPVVTGHAPGTSAYSSTSCGSSGTANLNATATELGNGTTNISGTGNTNASTNCETVYHEATPGHDTYVQQVGLLATIPALNKDVLLWCAVDWRQCQVLAQGTYNAEIKGDVVWIYVFGGTRPAKIKYRIVDSALLGLKDDVENSPKAEQCSSLDSKNQCQAVMDCERKGGTHEYCELWNGRAGESKPK